MGNSWFIDRRIQPRTSADYELIAECGTREAAEEFLKNDNEEFERRDGPIGFAD